MFNAAASLQPHAVQPQVTRAGPLPAKQRDIGDLRHIHEAVPRGPLHVLEGHFDGAPLAGRQVDDTIEAVRVRQAMPDVVHAHDELQGRLIRVLDVDDQGLSPRQSGTGS